MSVMRMPTWPPAEARLMRWLALAVLIHGGLLLVPARDGTRHANPLTPLRIALSTPVPATPEPTTATDLLPAAVVAPEPAPLAAEPVVPAPSDTGDLPASDPSRGADAPPLSAARLFDLDSRREWRLDEPARQRRLGVPTPRALPDNWRSSIPYRTEPPGGRAVPERVEILDRWLAADGSHNVMVETPTGERLCGRGEAWNPMQPLVEPVMMFRSCGAAPPTFVWPARHGGEDAR